MLDIMTEIWGRVKYCPSESENSMRLLCQSSASNISYTHILSKTTDYTIYYFFYIQFRMVSFTLIRFFFFNRLDLEGDVLVFKLIYESAAMRVIAGPGSLTLAFKSLFLPCKLQQNAG